MDEVAMIKCMTMDEARKPFSTSLRGPVREALDAVGQRLGGKRGITQAVVEAALIEFLALPEPEQDAAVGRVMASQMTGGAWGLVRESRVRAKRSRGPAGYSIGDES